MIELLIEQRRKSLGGGMSVGRVLPFAQRRMVGPFVFFDHMGPVDLARGVDRTIDVRPHPHIGLSTVTYLFAGEIMHRDSVGWRAVRPGEVNWMTAGRGITHSERFEKARAEGDHLHGIQAWVALPTEDEETDADLLASRGRGPAAMERSRRSRSADRGRRLRPDRGRPDPFAAVLCPSRYGSPGATAEIPSGHS